MIMTLSLQFSTLRNLAADTQLKLICFDSALKMYRIFNLILKL